MHISSLDGCECVRRGAAQRTQLPELLLLRVELLLFVLFSRNAPPLRLSVDPPSTTEKVETTGGIYGEGVRAVRTTLPCALCCVRRGDGAAS